MPEREFMKLPILLASIVLAIGIQPDASAVDPVKLPMTAQQHDLPPGVHPMCRSKLGWKQIITDMNLRIAKDPNDAEAYCRRGSAYSHFDQPELSLKDLSKAIQLKPDYANAYLERGNTYSICLNDEKHAIEDYTSAIRVNPMAVDKSKQFPNNDRRVRNTAVHKIVLSRQHSLLDIFN